MLGRDCSEEDVTKREFFWMAYMNDALGQFPHGVKMEKLFLMIGIRSNFNKKS